MLPLVGQDEQPARGLLGRFQFGPDEVEKQVGMLSGGERSRLRLLTLLVGDANFLLLDEPTNHLDMGSVEALADALEDYTGTILLVTHDRHLIDRVATRVLEITTAACSTTSRRRGTGRRAGGAPGHRARAATPEPAERGKARRQGCAGRRRRDSRQGERRGGAPPPRPPARRRGGVLKAEKRLGEIDAELAEPETYADRDVLNRLLDERGVVEDAAPARVRGLGEARRRADADLPPRPSRPNLR